ncbi:DUF58 domain-containing protein [Halomonas salinarum]|uniref:DUF58 domain-containing protein n=1 Tax=Halomonas salinarum TaxID=1158993 RepID=UPI001438F11D|nr:DUF58 domain-containing protein [Halomonas salinarum]
MRYRDASGAGPLARGWAWLRHWSWKRRSIPADAPLSQHRLFVVPTGFGLAWAGLVLILFLFGANYQNNLAYGLSFWLFAIALVALFRGWRNLLGVRLTITPEGEAFVGSEAQLRVRLAASRDRQALVVCLGRRLGRRAGRRAKPQHAGSRETVDVVDGEASLTIGWPVTIRGAQPLPRLRLESDWPLGLVRALAWIESPETLLVYPEPLSGAETVTPSPVAGQTAPEVARPRAPREAQDFAGLKRYVPGDSPSRLAWKQWSRTGVLATKHFTEPPAPPTWLDYAAISGDREARLSWLCAQVLAYHRRGEPFGLRLPGLTLSPASGFAQRRRALSALAYFPSESASSEDISREGISQKRGFGEDVFREGLAPRAPDGDVPGDVPGNAAGEGTP